MGGAGFQGLPSVLIQFEIPVCVMLPLLTFRTGLPQTTLEMHTHRSMTPPSPSIPNSVSLTIRLVICYQLTSRLPWLGLVNQSLDVTYLKPTSKV